MSGVKYTALHFTDSFCAWYIQCCRTIPNDDYADGDDDDDDDDDHDHDGDGDGDGYGDGDGKNDDDDNNDDDDDNDDDNDDDHDGCGGVDGGVDEENLCNTLRKEYNARVLIHHPNIHSWLLIAIHLSQQLQIP